MNDIILQNNKFINTAGVLIMAVSAILSITFLLLGKLAATIVCVLFVILGIIIVLAYKKEMIILRENEVIFKYLFQSTKQIQYKDIHCVLNIPLKNTLQQVLVDKHYNRVASLNQQLNEMELFYDTLNRKGIPVFDFGEMVEKQQNVSQYIRVLNASERNYYKSVSSENRTIAKLLKGDVGFDEVPTKKHLRIMGWILIFVVPIALLIGGKGKFVLLIAELLVAYGIYLKYYPYIYIERVTKKGKEHALHVPFTGPAIVLILLLLYMRGMNFEFFVFVKWMAVIFGVLVIPFLIKLIRTDVPQRLSRKGTVIFVAAAMAFIITLPVNNLLTFAPAEHETIVITKKNASGGKMRHYYLYGKWRGSNESFNVSSGVYYDTEIGDQRNVCINRSILGLEYYTIHK